MQQQKLLHKINLKQFLSHSWTDCLYTVAGLQSFKVGIESLTLTYFTGAKIKAEIVHIDFDAFTINTKKS